MVPCAQIPNSHQLACFFSLARPLRLLSEANTPSFFSCVEVETPPSSFSCPSSLITARFLPFLWIPFWLAPFRRSSFSHAFHQKDVSSDSKPDLKLHPLTYPSIPYLIAHGVSATPPPVRSRLNLKLFQATVLCVLPFSLTSQFSAQRIDIRTSPPCVGLPLPINFPNRLFLDMSSL